MFVLGIVHFDNDASVMCILILSEIKNTSILGHHIKPYRILNMLKQYSSKINDPVLFYRGGCKFYKISSNNTFIDSNCKNQYNPSKHETTSFKCLQSTYEFLNK